MQGVYEGFGGDFSSFAYGSPDYLKLAHIERNVYQFSGAKNYQQLRDLTSLIKDGDRIRSYKEFREKALPIMEEYQGRWLQTEYNLAVAGSQMASKWVQFEKNPKALLEYRTMEDGRVRDDHRLLDRKTRPVGDPFWSTYYPPNGFNCRCTVIELNSGKATKDNDMQYPDIPKMFQTNLGKEGLVFPKGHPYFIGLPKDVKNQIINLVPDHPQPPKKAVTNTKAIQKQTIADTMESALNLKPKSVSFDAKLSLDDITLRTEQLKKLVSEYQPFNSYLSSSEPKIAYNSTRSSYGFISTSDNGARIVEINFGSKVDASRASDPGDLLRPKSRVDPENIPVSTLTHEFAHLLGVQHQSHLSPKLKTFFTSLGKIKEDYSSELRSVANNHSEIKKIHLGGYASYNLNEFMAEGFTEYKLTKHPSKYAKEIGALIDKTFKK